LSHETSTSSVGTQSGGWSVVLEVSVVDPVVVVVPAVVVVPSVVVVEVSVVAVVAVVEVDVSVGSTLCVSLSIDVVGSPVVVVVEPVPVIESPLVLVGVPVGSGVVSVPVSLASLDELVAPSVTPAVSPPLGLQAMSIRPKLVITRARTVSSLLFNMEAQDNRRPRAMPRPMSSRRRRRPAMNGPSPAA